MPPVTLERDRRRMAWTRLAGRYKDERDRLARQVAQMRELAETWERDPALNYSARYVADIRAALADGAA